MTMLEYKLQLEEAGYEFIAGESFGIAWWECRDRESWERVAVSKYLGECIWLAANKLGCV